MEFYGMRVKAVPWDADARLKLAQAEAAANAQRNEAIQLLTSVASSSNASYARRASAAESLAALKAPAPSPGSAELEWLMRGGPVAGVESPGFFYARLRAAREATDAATKIRLLLEAIALRPEDFSQRFTAYPRTAANPEGVSPRILLAQAAATANQNELAVSAIAPLLDWSIAIGPTLESRASEATGEEMEQPAYPSDMWKSFLAGQDLNADQKSLIAAQLASAFQKLDRLGEAARLWKAASMLATDDSLRSQASHELEHVQALLRFEQADRERRPGITNHLEQKGLVRPRLAPESVAAVREPPLRLGGDGARRPNALHREAGRAFTPRRVMDAQGAQPATARRRVRLSPAGFDAGVGGGAGQ
jgi:hypothetical protein